MSLLPRLDEALPVPAPFCPIAPTAVMVDGDLLQERTTAWLQRSGMCLDEVQSRRLARVNAGHLTSHGVPDGLPETTQIASDALMWLFAVDDYCDETELSRQPIAYAALATQIHRAIEAPEAVDSSTNPYVASACDVRLRLEATGATPVQITRWTYGIRTFLFGQVRECQARATGFVPDLNEFMALRLDTTGGLPVFALNDYARGFHLPSAEANRPAVRALTEMAVMLVGLDDEIVSFHKECHRSPDDLNIIGIIAHHNNVSALQALTETIAMRDKIMARFVHLSAHVSMHCGHELSRYLQSLHTWVRAWMDWSYNVDRYLNPDAPADLTGGCHDSWPEHSHQSLTIPTIAWWWEISWSPS